MADDLQQKLLVELQRLFEPSKIKDIAELRNHTVNTLYSFTKENEEFIVKILTRPPTSEHEAYRLKKEADLFKHFSELQNLKGVDPSQLIYVPVPKVIHYELDEEKLDYQYYIMSKVSGTPLESVWPKLTFEQKEKFVIEFASVVRGIHSITYEMFGEIEQYDCPRQFFSMKSMIKADARRCARMLGNNKLLPMKLVTKTLTYIEKSLEKANFSENPKLVHTDLNPVNIIVEEINGEIKIRGILDFEWSYAGDPIYDLLSIEHEWMEDEKIRKIFHNEYSQGSFTDLKIFETEIQIFKALENLSTVAFGWVYFHPTKENLEHIENRLRKIIDEE